VPLIAFRERVDILPALIGKQRVDHEARRFVLWPGEGSMSVFLGIITWLLSAWFPQLQ